MQTLTVSSKGQIVLPTDIRRRFGLTAGSRLYVQETDQGLQLTVVNPVTPASVVASAGLVTAPSRGAPRRLEDFDAADFAADPLA